jgi:hypothetical protein
VPWRITGVRRVPRAPGVPRVPGARNAVSAKGASVPGMLNGEVIEGSRFLAALFR